MRKAKVKYLHVGKSETDIQSGSLTRKGFREIGIGSDYVAVGGRGSEVNDEVMHFIKENDYDFVLFERPNILQTWLPIELKKMGIKTVLWLFDKTAKHKEDLIGHYFDFGKECDYVFTTGQSVEYIGYLKAKGMNVSTLHQSYGYVNEEHIENCIMNLDRNGKGIFVGDVYDYGSKPTRYEVVNGSNEPVIIYNRRRPTSTHVDFNLGSKGVGVEGGELALLYSSYSFGLSLKAEPSDFSGSWSNRLWTMMFCGIPILCQWVKEMESVFGDRLMYFKTVEEYNELSKFVIDNPVKCEIKALQNKVWVAMNHNWVHRALQMKGIIG